MRITAAFLIGLFLVAADPSDSSAGIGEISKPTISRSLSHEFGAARGSFLVPSGLISEQIMMALGIPNPDLQLASGEYLVSGCRPHSCDEKAAVIVTPRGMVMAAGLINFHCHRLFTKSGKPIRCDARPRLTLFLKQNSSRFDLKRQLKNWASHQTLIETTEIHLLPSG